MCVQELETGLGRRGVDPDAMLLHSATPAKRAPVLAWARFLNIALKVEGNPCVSDVCTPLPGPSVYSRVDLGVIWGRGGLFKATFLVGKHSGYKYAKFDQAPSARL